MWLAWGPTERAWTWAWSFDLMFRALCFIHILHSTAACKVEPKDRKSKHKLAFFPNQCWKPMYQQLQKEGLPILLQNLGGLWSPSVFQPLISMPSVFFLLFLRLIPISQPTQKSHAPRTRKKHCPFTAEITCNHFYYTCSSKINIFVT